MKLIAYQQGDDRIMARVLDDKAVPFASLGDFWANPQQSLLAAAEKRSGGELITNLVQVPPLPDTARILCAGLNYVAHAEEAHFNVPEHPDIFARWRSTLVQDGNTSNLMFSGAKLAAYASGAMTLKPGDLIATGTPDGIGATRKPPMFLHPGETVAVDIERIGRITNGIVQR